MVRRHPRGTDLGAWFDGEAADRVGTHVARCHRCQRRVAELGRVRSWLRAQPFVAMTDAAGEPPQPRRPLWRPVAVAAAVVAAALTVGGGDQAPSSPGSAALGRAPAAGDGDPAGAGATPSPEPPGPAAAPPGSAPPAVAPPPLAAVVPAAPPADQPTPTVPALSSEAPVPTGPLRLGLVVPARGPQAAEGAAIERVVRQQVAAANSAGGVAGFPVELVVVAAEDAAAVARLAGQVHALVGGFGVAAPPPGVPWLLPADPSIAGPAVVSAEAVPQAAGVQLAQVLRRSGLRGPVGVVVGTGPDAALAAGLGGSAATTTVTARPGTSCAAEVASLAAAGATALAVAGDPDLAARCLRALARSSWRPAHGTVLAPSAAYAGLEKLPEASGSRTVLSLPWPTSILPGAARFRATAESSSYRAMVSYAATELAIAVARQTGDLSVASVAAGTWRSDLLDLRGLVSATPIVVTALLGTWLPSL